jgi:hypothetical protein
MTINIPLQSLVGREVGNVRRLAPRRASCGTIEAREVDHLRGACPNLLELDIWSLTVSQPVIAWDFMHLTRLTVTQMNRTGNDGVSVTLRLPDLASLEMDVRVASELDLRACIRLAEVRLIADEGGAIRDPLPVRADACVQLQDLDLGSCMERSVDMTLPDGLRLNRLGYFTGELCDLRPNPAAVRTARVVCFDDMDMDWDFLAEIDVEELIIRTIAEEPIYLMLPEMCALKTLTIELDDPGVRGFSAIGCSGCPSLTRITRVVNNGLWCEQVPCKILLHPAARPEFIDMGTVREDVVLADGTRRVLVDDEE